MENQSTLMHTASAASREKQKARPERIKNIIVTIVLSIGAVIMLYPFLWLVLTTFRPWTSINYTFLSKEWFAVQIDGEAAWNFEAYKNMYESSFFTIYDGGIWRGFLNSFLTTVPVVVVQVFVSAFAAYAFAKIRFAGKNAVFLFMLGTMMIPFAVVMLPQSWWYGKLGLTANGVMAVVVPKLFGSVTTVFFLRQFLYGIPDSISESARLDGAGYTRTFISIILPLIMPALATQAILSFIGNWNDFLGPLLFINDQNWWTLPLLVNKLNENDSGIGIPSSLAASLVSLIPIIIVFAAFQKKIVGSIVFSAVKG